MLTIIRLTTVFFLLGISISAFAQWTPLVSGTTRDLHDLYMFDSNYGVAVGDEGTVLLTTDKGDHWQSIGGNLTGSLRSVVVLSHDHFLVAEGDIFYGRVFETTNGGMHWDSIAPGANLALTGTGVFALNYQTVLYSDDNANNFYPTGINIGGTTLPEKLLFPTDHVGYVCGNISGFAAYANYGYRSDDGGGNWKELFPFDYPGNGVYTAAHYINADTGYYFVNINVGFQTGPINKLHRFHDFYYDNTPGIDSWRFTGEIVNETLPAFMNDGWFADYFKGWAAGDNGVLYVTADAGITWEVAYQNTGALYGITALDGIAAFVVGANGTILRNSLVDGTRPEPVYTDLSIFPNPANANITIDLPTGFEPVQIQWYDLAGHLIEVQAISGNAVLNTRSLADGLYLVTVVGTTGKTARGKVLIAH